MELCDSVTFRLSFEEHVSYFDLTLLSVLCSFQQELYSFLSVLYSFLSVLFSFQCVLFSFRCVLYSFLSVLFSFRCVLFSFRCVLFSYRCVLCSFQQELYSQLSSLRLLISNTRYFNCFQLQDNPPDKRCSFQIRSLLFLKSMYSGHCLYPSPFVTFRQVCIVLKWKRYHPILCKKE